MRLIIMKEKNVEWYNIAQVSEMTQLSKQVIRKWEQRYSLIQPQRLENGHRVYSKEDIKTLEKAQKYIEEGYSIKQAAAILVEEEQQPKNVWGLNNIKSSFEVESAERLVEILLIEGEKCREVELSRLISHAHQMLGLYPFLQDVIIPFLTKVGEMWQEKRWSEYQEAFCSMVVRDYLVQIRRQYEVPSQAPLLMGACLPGEQHEIQMHVLLLYAAMAGWRTVLVGSSPAVGAIQSLVEQLQPNIVLLSAMTTRPFECYPLVVKELDNFAAHQKDVKFYIGGAGTYRFFRQEDLQYIHMTNDLGEVLRKS